MLRRMTSTEGGVVTEDDANTFRESREYARGTLDVEHHDVHPFAGLVDDPDVREMLSFMAEIYSPFDEDGNRIEELPKTFWETEFARETIRKHATEKLTEAVDEGNLTQAAFMSGLPSYRSDVSGMQAINQLANWLIHSENCKLIYMAALMGKGKTDLAVTFFEVIHDHYQRIRRSLKEHGLDDAVGDLPEPEFAANFDVSSRPDLDVEIKEIRNERQLLEWAEGGSSEDVRWFIFDEASTALTAQSGSNAQDVAEKMAPFVKRMRKVGINMIVIGHDKGDVHVAIRSLADFVDKTGLKTASFYAGITKREPQGHLFDVEGIPETSWDFDTDDMAEWAWMDDGEEVEDEGLDQTALKQEVATRGAALWKQTDLNQDDVADALTTPDLRITPTDISRAQDRVSDNGNIAKAT